MTNPLRILSFRVVNFERVELVELDRAGKVVTIAGENEAGKSSTLNGLKTALAGVDNRRIRMPVHAGADQAEIYIVLGDDERERYRIEAVVKPDGKTTYKIFAPLADGGFAPLEPPRSVIDDLVGAISFDIAAWARAGEKEQAVMLQEAMGVDFSDLDEQRDGAYLQRTDVNREAGRLKSVIDSMEVYPDVGEEIENVAALSGQLDESLQINRANGDRRQRLQQLTDTADELRGTIAQTKERQEDLTAKLGDDQKRLDDLGDVREILTSRQSERLQLTAQLGRLDEQIEEDRQGVDAASRLENEIVRRQDALGSQNDRFDELASELVETETSIAAAADADALEDIDLDPIRERIAGAEDVNAKIRSNRERAERVVELELTRAESEELTERINGLDEERAERLAAVDFPVSDLSFSIDGGILYKGNPVKQAGAAREMEISMSVAMAMNPTLRAIFLRDASLLTAKSMKRVLAMAAAAGYQIFVEDARALEDAPSVLWIEDGTVREGGEG